MVTAAPVPVSVPVQALALLVATASTMKEAIVKPDVTVAIIDSEIPKPGPDQVLIKVVVSGSNPKDWYGDAIFSICYVLRLKYIHIYIYI